MSKANNKSLFLVAHRETAGAPQLKKESISKVVAIGSSGEIVLVGGDYSIRHPEHNLPRAVTLLEGEKFPKCEACDETVSFELLEALPGLTRGQHPIVLNMLPVMPDEEQHARRFRLAS